ncbi:hypothetical protein BD408DRAFT_420330, partial [Parasitella parasitica]
MGMLVQAVGVGKWLQLPTLIISTSRAKNIPLFIFPTGILELDNNSGVSPDLHGCINYMSDSPDHVVTVDCTASKAIVTYVPLD